MVGECGYRRPYTVMLVIPTGVGAAIGGYGGDALPVARVIATVADILITHPNVMNGAQLYWPLDNGYYVEGYGLDQFAAGVWGLRPGHGNRIALILDRGLEEELFWRHRQVAEACRATLGLALQDYVLTDQPLGVKLSQADSGTSWGTLEHPDSLLRAAERAISAGAQAIAVVARFPETIEHNLVQAYRQGQGVDPVAGAEAVISHLVVRTFAIPCAHAPAFSPTPLDRTVAPKAAAEEIGYTFLPCVLAGLSRAPQFVTSGQANRGDLWVNQVDAMVVPAGACGGSAVLSLSQTPALIIGVEANTTCLKVTPEALGIQAIRVGNYLEAIGLLAAHRAGVDPSMLGSQVRPLQEQQAGSPGKT
ncbi:MAG: DUF3326 domain-containing protein [Nodosilinea sp.]